MQIMRMDVEYLGESGFMVSSGEEALLFDPGAGEEEAHILPEADALAAFRKLTVFVTRPGEAHLSPELRGRCPAGTAFVLSSDLPEEEEGTRMAAGDSLEVNGVKITACPSTDAGIAFLCEWLGARVFHAGGLNLWHWRDISTIPEIEAAEQAFNDCLSAIPNETIDLAFFPLDPRQGRMYDAGAGAFVMTVKPRVLIPMQFRGRQDAAEDFAVRGSTSATRVEVLPQAGEKLTVTLPDPESGAEPEETERTEEAAETAEESPTETEPAPEGARGSAEEGAGLPEEDRTEAAEPGHTAESVGMYKAEEE